MAPVGLQESPDQAVEDLEAKRPNKNIQMYNMIRERERWAAHKLPTLGSPLPNIATVSGISGASRNDIGN